MRSQTYKDQDGCHNCRWAFRRVEYEEGAELFCALTGADNRPKCGSVAMGEHFGGSLVDETYDERFDTESAAWDAWSEPRKVKPSGICDVHERGTDER